MFLLDTNIISEMRAKNSRKPDPNFEKWKRKIHIDDCFLSVITIYEVEVGALRIENRKDTLQASKLRLWMQDEIQSRFDSRILPIGVPEARAAARLQTIRTIELRDTYIAATALAHRLTLVTRNVRHFEGLGLTIINPWDS